MQNTVDLQAVYSEDRANAGIVFYQAGRFGSEPAIQVDHPCLLMLIQKPGGVQLSVSDPTQKLEEIRILVDGAYQHELASILDGKTHLSISLPSDGEAGKTVTLDLIKQF